MNKHQEKHQILVVDDTPTNLDLLVELLGNDYDVVAAISGETAFEIIDESLPDIILLDVMMPDLSGFEVCNRLKASQETSEIPVIFVTALDEPQDTTKGFQVGAVDFVSKPFDPDILKARVRTHLGLRDARAELAQQNERLEEIVKNRTQALQEAHDRLKGLDQMKNDFLQGLSHDLRTPANGILGLGEIAFDSMKEHDPERYKELKNLFNITSERMIETIDSALLLVELQTRDGRLKTEPVMMGEILEAIRQRAPHELSSLDIESLRPQLTDLAIIGHEPLLEDSLTNLILASARLAKPGTQLRYSIVNSRRDCLDLIIAFECSSTALPPAFIDSFFEVFSESRISSQLEDLGLKIPVASRIITSLGGQVSIAKPAAEEGRMTVTLRK